MRSSTTWLWSGWRPVPPDVLGSVGHDSTSHASASEINSVSACEVSLVARCGRGRQRLVARSGMLSTICSRSATRTWPGACSGAKMEMSWKRRPKSGCVGSVTSISWVGSLRGFLKGVLRYSVVRWPQPRRLVTHARRPANEPSAAQRLAESRRVGQGGLASNRSGDTARGSRLPRLSQRGPAWAGGKEPAGPTGAERPGRESIGGRSGGHTPGSGRDRATSGVAGGPLARDGSGTAAEPNPAYPPVARRRGGSRR